MTGFLLAAGFISVSGPAHASDSLETMPLWRIQLIVTTGSTPGAGTTGLPAVRFNGTATGVRTLNPYDSTSFGLSRATKYEVRLGDLATASQITTLRFGIADSDGWCFNHVSLLLNNRVAFDAPVDSWENPGICHTVTPGVVISYSYAELRANAHWRAYGARPALPTQLPGSDLASLVSDVSGSAIVAAGSIRWDRSAPVEVRRVTSSRVRVSFAVTIADPVEPPFRQAVVYDLQFYVGSDGHLHATAYGVPQLDHSGLAAAVAAQLDVALGRETVHPAPSNPLHFSVNSATTISWTWTPVVIG